jgi:hypothetical protein
MSWITFTTLPISMERWANESILLAAVLNGWRFAGSDRIDEALPRGKEDVGADCV